jgi:cellulose synthase/poly-beta-1,6-N-acetylglucosamine synthase-like glycosyltransferase
LDNFLLALTVITVLLSVLLAAAGIYLLALTVAGLFYRNPGRWHAAPWTRFAVLAPAHNEEMLLPRLLASLKQASYPAEMVRVFVVADNCTDATAVIGREHRATVFERADAVKRGKGYALQWLLPQVRSSGYDYDAYVLLDADCLVSENFFDVLDQYLQSGSTAVQSYYTASNPYESPVSTLRYMALALMHLTRPRGQQALGLSCGLFGTGMAFRRDLLDNLDWNAFSLAEDAEYQMRLASLGIKVDFAQEAVTAGEMPGTFKGAGSQNKRWEKGRLQLFRRHGWRLFISGLLEGSPMKAEVGIRSAVPPMSILGVAIAAVFGMGLALGSGASVALSALAAGGLLGHVSIGLLTARIPLRAYRALGYAPLFIFWKLWIYVSALRPAESEWVRTQRSKQ